MNPKKKEFQKDVKGLEHSALKITMIQASKQVFSIYTGISLNKGTYLVF
jgi:hypothetical protein